MIIRPNQRSRIIWLMVLLAMTQVLFCNRAQAQEKKRRSLKEVRQHNGGSQGIADIFSESGREAEAQRWDLVFLPDSQTASCAGLSGRGRNGAGKTGGR